MAPLSCAHTYTGEESDKIIYLPKVTNLKTEDFKFFDTVMVVKSEQHLKYVSHADSLIVFCSCKLGVFS